jgi:hypothetical protein
MINLPALLGVFISILWPTYEVILVVANNLLTFELQNFSWLGCPAPGDFKIELFSSQVKNNFPLLVQTAN